MDGGWAEGWTSLKTPGAFQHVFRILIFPRSGGTGTPFLAEKAEVRQDFFSFFRFFLRLAFASGYFRA
jgi:hypothetical protein